MARFGLWVAALSLVCLIAVVTSQNAPITTLSSNEADITATCTKFFDVNNKMCLSSGVSMVYNNFLTYYKEMHPEQVRETMKTYDNNGDGFLDLNECQNFVNFIKQNAPNTN